jgi:hypothetical protein
VCVAEFDVLSEILLLCDLVVVCESENEDDWEFDSEGNSDNVWVTLFEPLAEKVSVALRVGGDGDTDIVADKDGDAESEFVQVWMQVIEGVWESDPLALIVADDNEQDTDGDPFLVGVVVDDIEWDDDFVGV